MPGWPSRGILTSVFGVSPQEMVIVGLIFLLIFGPGKLPQMARDLGKFVSEARRSIDEFKSEITAAGDDDDEDKPSIRKTRKK